jgi:hypothetical protein
MKCILRATSPTFDVDAFLGSSHWKPEVVHHVGERAGPTARRKTSGFHLAVSKEGSENLEHQFPAALEFLARERDEIARVVASAGRENVVLDFGFFYELRRQSWSQRIPATVLAAAASAGIDVVVSAYSLG